MSSFDKHIKVVTLALLSITISACTTQLYINKQQEKNENVNNKIINESLMENKVIDINALLIKVDEKEIGFLKNEEEIKEVLDYVRDYYVRKNNIKVLKGYKLKSNITYSVTKTNINKIMDSKKMSEYIIKNKNLITFELSGINEEQQNINPGVIINWSEQLLKGESTVKYEGQNGTKVVTKDTIFDNDRITSEKIINQKIIKPCKDKIIVKGIKNPNVVASTSVILPSRGSISSTFGERWGKMHKGIDIAASIGTPIYAIEDGKVNYSNIQDGYGKVIKISHDNGMETVYAHCNVLNVKVGEKVKKGQKIAEVGNTGRSTGPHVHFEVIVNGVVKNPMEYLRNNWQY